MLGHGRGREEHDGGNEADEHGAEAGDHGTRIHALGVVEHLQDASEEPRPSPKGGNHALSQPSVISRKRSPEVSVQYLQVT